MTMLNTGGHGVRRLPAFQMQGRPSDYAIKPIDWGGAVQSGIQAYQGAQDRARLRRLQEMEEEGANVRLREALRAEEAALAEEERMARLGEHWEGLAGEHEQNQMRSGFDFDAVDPETGQVGVPLGGWDDPQAPSLTGDPRQDQVTKELVEMAKLDPTIFQDTKRLKGFLDQKMQSWAQEDQMGGGFQVRELPNVGKVVIGPDGRPVPKSAIFEEGSSVPAGFHVQTATDWTTGEPTDTKILVDAQGRYKAQLPREPRDQFKEQVENLMETGLNREEAQMIASNRVRAALDPYTREWGAFDIADGLRGRQPQEGGLPSSAGTETQSSMPSDVRYQSATGARGFAAQIANTASEILNLGLVDPENERATQALNNLQTRTMVDLASSVAGRPSNYLLERLERLTVQPNSPFKGPGRALERLRQTRDVINQGVAENEAVLNMAAPPAVKVEATQNLVRLRSMLADYNAVINNFQDIPATGTPSGGASVSNTGLQPPEGAPDDILEHWNYWTEAEQQELINMYREGQ